MAITCLLIDDDKDDQEIFLLALQRINSAIVCKVANNGMEGLEALQDHSFLPDFIFVDINMPKMNGMECVTALRQLDRLQASWITIYSTSMDSALAAQCKSAGADDVLMKPPAFWQLIDSLLPVFNIGQQ